MESYGEYRFKIVFGVGKNWEGWVYEIYYKNYPEMPFLRTSDEWFDTEFQARCAAMEYISLLENGEG